MTTDPIQAGITEKRLFLRSAKKCFLAKKRVLSQKTPNISKEIDIYLEKGNFFWLELRSDRLFLGPEISVFGRKIRFLPYDPNFGQQPTVGEHLLLKHPVEHIQKP